MSLLINPFTGVNGYIWEEKPTTFFDFKKKKTLFFRIETFF